MRSGLDPERLAATIYGAEGIKRYIEDQIEISKFGCDTCYIVAYEGDNIAGCIDVRHFGDQIFLNYISVLPEYRAHGLGRQLLKAALNPAVQKWAHQMSLDVMLDNTIALNWYEKIGFIPDVLTTWWDIPIPNSNIESTATVIGYPQARVCYDTFGFSQFKLITPLGEYTLGMMCRKWFRITQPEALIDPSVTYMLRKFDPSRHILAIIPDEHMPTTIMANSKVITRSMRMSVSVKHLTKRLS